MLACIIFPQMLGIPVSVQNVFSFTFIFTLITAERFKYLCMSCFYVSFHIIRPCKLFRTNVAFVSLDSQVNGFFVNFQAAIPCSLVITKITTKSYTFMHRHSMFSQRARAFCLIFAGVTLICCHFTMLASSVLAEILCVVGLIAANLTVRQGA